MLKITALVFLASAFVLTGQYANIRLKKRLSSLENLVIFIEGINSQISFSQNNITDIMKNLNDSANHNLKIINELIDMSGNDFTKNWEKSVEMFSRYDCLNKEDKNILLSFGKTLGVTDLQGQSNNCRLHIGMLNRQLSSARENVRDRSKINTAISAFFAVAAVIIFY